MARAPLNILWMQTDEQRCDSLGCYGSARMRTPHIDALAARGTLFANHHVQSPVCVPSRVCELASRYPHQTGVSAGVVTHALTEQVDLAPTLLRLAGLQAHVELAGRDLLFPETPRDDVIGEIATARAAQDAFLMPSRQRGYLRRSWIRTARWSLDYTSEIDGRPAEPDEWDGKLIDLQLDPLAHRNLYREPGYRDVITELQARFEARTREGRRPVQIGAQPAWQ